MSVLKLMIELLISIHALVKRATALSRLNSLIDTISIHALVKRATGVWVLADQQLTISIHALVKRATRYCTEKQRRF